MRNGIARFLGVLCLFAVTGPALADTQEPKAPYAGLDRWRAWELNERWYEDKVTPIEAKIGANWDDFQARRISEETYLRRNTELQRAAGDLLRRKEANSLQIVRYFDRLSSDAAATNRVDEKKKRRLVDGVIAKNPRRRANYPTRLSRGQWQVQLADGKWVPGRRTPDGRWEPAR